MYRTLKMTRKFRLFLLSFAGMAGMAGTPHEREVHRRG
jgi:hypothetical protein